MEIAGRPLASATPIKAARVRNSRRFDRLGRASAGGTWAAGCSGRSDRFMPPSVAPKSWVHFVQDKIMTVDDIMLPSPFPVGLAACPPVRAPADRFAHDPRSDGFAPPLSPLAVPIPLPGFRCPPDGRGKPAEMLRSMMQLLHPKNRARTDCPLESLNTSCLVIRTCQDGRTRQLAENR